AYQRKFQEVSSTVKKTNIIKMVKRNSSSLVPLEKHYCRASSKMRQYLPSHLSISKLCAAYNNNATSEFKVPYSYFYEPKDKIASAVYHRLNNTNFVKSSVVRLFADGFPVGVPIKKNKICDFYHELSIISPVVGAVFFRSAVKGSFFASSTSLLASFSRCFALFACNSCLYVFLSFAARSQVDQRCIAVGGFCDVCFEVPCNDDVSVLSCLGNDFYHNFHKHCVFYCHLWIHINAYDN
ncbi:hypothetical protein L9F63_010176, partial [Diploptera punctata]